MEQDLQWMHRALALAERGRFSASPNPMVGCVVVREDRLIGEGFHLRAGLGHAETEALKSCSEETEGAVVYVTLAPCNHHGSTPPCTDALTKAKVSRVVVAIDDPHQPGEESGIESLRRRGIQVDVGLLAEEAARLNEKFLYSQTRDMPFVLLKAGTSLDGKLATVTGQSQWITSEASRRKGLELREEYDAILVGGGTVASDNPLLTRRLGWNSSVNGWLRVVVDSDGNVPARAAILSDNERTLIYTSGPERLSARQELEVVGVGGPVALTELLSDLHARGVQSLMIEGGAVVLSQFIREALWQKMVLFVAPIFVGGNAPAILQLNGITSLEEAQRFRFQSCEMVGSDLMVTAYP